MTYMVEKCIMLNNIGRTTEGKIKCFYKEILI